VLRVSDVRQIKIRVALLLGPDSSPFEVEITVTKLKKYKSPGSDQIPAELILAGSEILWSEILKLVYSIWNMEEWRDQWKKAIIVPVSSQG
jgi:hypothetical protein